MASETKEKPRSRVAGADRARRGKPAAPGAGAQRAGAAKAGEPAVAGVRRAAHAEEPAPVPVEEAPQAKASPAPSRARGRRGGTRAQVQPDEAGVAAAIDAVIAESRPVAALPEPVPGVMEFAVQAQALQAGLAAVVAGLPGKTTLPVLSHVLLETDGEHHVRLTATDLDTTVSRRIPAVVTVPGAALVPGRKLNEIAREIPDTCMLDVRLRDEKVGLWCQETRTRFKLPTLATDEFPSPPSVAWGADDHVVSARTLALLVERTAFAASTEETRPILNGVLWEFTAGQMGMAATNGHRLATTRVAAGSAPAKPEVIIHPRALALVARLPGEGEEVRVALGPNHIGFRGEGWCVLSRVIEGPYPTYRQVIPQDNDKSMIADKALLTAAVRRMAIMASEQTHRIRMSLGSEPGRMRISVETPDLGAAHEDVPVDYQGDPLEIGFNAQYLLEMLRYLPAGDVRMTFKAPERAATAAPVEDGTGASTEMLIMPLRLLN
jgi:DNA polymerase-3 subunit beta